jgi:hypothetical protein
LWFVSTEKSRIDFVDLLFVCARMSLLNHKSKGQQLVSSIEANDVVLGRGNHAHIDGNTKFRNLVRARSIEYWSCKDNFSKDIIARQIVDTVASLGGRFLNRVKPQQSSNIVADASAATNSDTASSDQWEVADKEIVLIKVKQTFRDFTASSRKKTASVASCTNREVTNAISSPSGQLFGNEPRSANQGDVTIQSAADPSNPNSTASIPFDVMRNSSNHNTLSQPPDSDIHQESLFQNIRTSQLNHLTSFVQQQTNQQNQDSQQLLSLLDHQRAILISQVQTSAVESHLWMPPDRQLRDYLSRLRHDPQHRQRRMEHDLADVNYSLLQTPAVPPTTIPSPVTLLNFSQMQSISRSFLPEREIFSGLEFQQQQLQQPLQPYVNRSLHGTGNQVALAPQYIRSLLDSRIMLEHAVTSRNTLLMSNINEMNAAISRGNNPPNDWTRRTVPVVPPQSAPSDDNDDTDSTCSDTKPPGR